jgi:serine/threonine-protein kinase RsbW
VNTIDEGRFAASLRLLVAASRHLSTSFDYTQTLAAVVRLVVPAFAAGLAVDVHEGELQTTIATSGRLDGDVREIPLTARGREIGLLRIASAREDEAGIDVWAELASRIAVAIDTAQLYARERLVADTLQRALLPERLPVDEHLAFDAAYLPGGEGTTVGGDWYDAFRLPDGRIAFSIGDVAGHGLRAAIVMGEVRQAFRAAALDPNSPSLVLERANTIVNMRANPVMVTAVFGIVDPREGTVTYACAGHPPPVLALPGGTTHVLPKDGLPLGIVDAVRASDWTFTIASGAIFALYTDGLIEYDRDLAAGESRLLDALRDALALRDGEPARAIVERIFDARENSDDVALLTLANTDALGARFTFTATAVPLAVPLARRSLQRYLQNAGADDDERFALLTASGEALANAVEHAYHGRPGLVRLTAWREDDTIVVVAEDEGRWKPAQRRDERGRGLPLMRALVDAVQIRTHMAHTEVRLTLALRRGRGLA